MGHPFRRAYQKIFGGSFILLRLAFLLSTVGVVDRTPKATACLATMRKDGRHAEQVQQECNVYNCKPEAECGYLRNQATG